MQQIYNTLFEHLPATSRVWIYQNQTAIEHDQQQILLQKLRSFVEQWTAHKIQLFGDVAILEDHFIVLAVDESITAASGCSIDSSVRFIKELEKEHELNLFDRLRVLIDDEGIKKIIHFSEINAHPNAYKYDSMITTLGAFRNNWKQKIGSI